MKKLKDQIAVQIEALKLNPDLAAMLLSRLQHYIDTANSIFNNPATRFLNLSSRKHIDLCKKLVRDITPLLKRNRSEVSDKRDKKSDKKEEAKNQDTDNALELLLSGLAAIPAMDINPNGDIAAILGAFLTLHPQHVRFFSFEFRDRLPIEEEWLHDANTRNKYIMLRNEIPKEPCRHISAPLYYSLTKSDLYGTVDAYCKKLLELPRNTWHIDLQFQIEDIFPYLNDEKSVCQESAVQIAGNLYRYAKDEKSVEHFFDSLMKTVETLPNTFLQRLDNAYQALATAYPNLPDRCQKLFFIHVIKLSHSTTQYDTLARIYEHIALYKIPSECTFESVDPIIEKLLADITTHGKPEDCSAALRIFNYNIIHEHRALILKTMVHLLNDLNAVPKFERIVCSVLIKMIPCLITEEISQVTPGALLICQKNTNLETAHLLLATLFPHSHDILQREKIRGVLQDHLNNKIKGNNLASDDTRVIACLPLTEQIELAGRLTKTIHDENSIALGRCHFFYHVKHIRENHQYHTEVEKNLNLFFLRL